MRKSVVAWNGLSLFALALFASTVSFNTADSATSSIKCSNGTVTVSTGTSSGTCVKEGKVITCGKNETNQAGGGCDASGKASCGNTTGGGSCTIKKLVTGVKPKIDLAPGARTGGVKAQ
jgi:hypothetical protein